MNEAESKAFLNRIGKEWLSLKENDKSSYEEKCKSLKKEFKNKIKEFLIVSLNWRLLFLPFF